MLIATDVASRGLDIKDIRYIKSTYDYISAILFCVVVLSILIFLDTLRTMCTE